MLHFYLLHLLALGTMMVAMRTVHVHPPLPFFSGPAAGGDVLAASGVCDMDCGRGCAVLAVPVVCGGEGAAAGLVVELCVEG